MYHCSAACRTFNPAPHTGDIFITISTWFSYNPVEGSVTFSFNVPSPYIRRPQLDAVKAIYDATCAPYQAPASYSGSTYVSQNSTDTDTMPYCDWLPGGWLDVWTETSCEEIPGVRCDADGNVVELAVSEKGLRGALPPNLAASLPNLEEVALDGNRLTGGVLELLRDSLRVETFSATRNNLTGPVPCPGAGNASEAAACASTTSQMYSYSLSFNNLEGTIPGECIARCAPRLAALQLESNRLTGTVPAALAGLSELELLDVSQNVLTGTLPPDLATLDRLQTLDLSLNRFYGTVPSSWMTRMSSLFTLDLSFNRLEGEFPDIGADLSRLRRLFLGHNRLSGRFEGQLMRLADALQTDRDAFASGATYSLLSNAFSGPLPPAMYALFTTPSTAVTLAALELGGNHFRCDPDTGSWPLWALRLKLSHSHVLGQCTPVPTVTAVSPAAAAPGEPLTLTGRAYQPSEEARCRFTLPDGNGVRYSPAAVAPGGAATCPLPDDILAGSEAAGAGGGGGVAAGDEVEVSIAMYGDDFYDPSTVAPGMYAPVKVRVSCAEGYAGKRCQFSDGVTCGGNGEDGVGVGTERSLDSIFSTLSFHE